MAISGATVGAINISPKPPKKPVNINSGEGSKVSFSKGQKEANVSYVGKKPQSPPTLSQADITAFNILAQKTTSTPIIKDSNIDGNIVNVQINKSVYGNYAVNNNLDSDFTEFNNTDLNKDIVTFFNLYEELFYEIPTKGGLNTHETLVLRSRDYLRGFVDPKDIEIENLNDQIEELQDRILQLESKPPIELNDDLKDQLEGLATNVNEAVEDIEEDLEAEAAIPEIVDENDDGIDDTLQSFSNFGTPKRLILGASNSTARSVLQNPGCVYYKDKYYGRQIYIFKKKVDGKRNRVIIYDGARGKKGKRYLIDLDAGSSHKIKKRNWKSKNYTRVDTSSN